MRLPGRGPSDLVELLFAVHQAGCSPDSLAKLAGAVQSAGGFSGVLIALGEAGTARVGRSGSRGSLRVLDGRLAQPGPAADAGTFRSWPITDPAGTELGRLLCLLGANSAPPTGELQASIALVCGQLGVAGRQLQLEQQLRDGRRMLLAEQADRRLAERAYDLIFDESAIGMATASLATQDAGRLVAVNDALCHLTGRTIEQLLTLTYAELTHPDDRHAGSSALRRAMAGRRTPVRSRIRFLRADGSVVWVQVTACPLFDDEDRPLYQMLQVEDLSARADAEAELLASQDPLTGLLTGAALHERMVDVLDRARRLETTGVVLVCDLDRLTRSAGPTGEDAIRQAVADTLGRTLRNGDIIARIGQNRFAVVAEEVRPEHAASVARRMTEALRGDAASIDIGVSLLSAEVADPDVLFERATEAMLDARDAGESYLLYHRDAERIDRIAREVLYSAPGWSG
ncbi:MAG TPA: PAS domain S-box protein [Jatrophihabitans sp.]|jgi:PAS domain S-box-containing protein/diguanylate cyclase (GGDEF)-like protein|nr:PAS domain S-box protein [Jatrophihabitans sp.]